MSTTRFSTPILRAVSAPLIAALFCGPAVSLSWGATLTKSAKPAKPAKVQRRSLPVLTKTGNGVVTNGAPPTRSAAREWNEQTLSAIRINAPNPPAHARNLHHVAVAMYDAWAAYDTTAVGYIYNEKISPLPSDVEAARREAISYAAYRVLRARFVTASPTPPGAAATSTSIDNELTALGYSVATAQAALVPGDTSPAELGKRIGQNILTWGATDGFSQTAYPAPYNVAANPNMQPERAMSVLGNNGEGPPSQPNMPLGVGIPLIANTAQAYTFDTDPNYWQPLALSANVTQNGIPTPGGTQAFVGVQSLATTPFSLTRTDPLKPWIDGGGPSRISVPGSPSPTDAAYKAAALENLTKSSQLNDSTVIDISPGAIGNNPLGTDSGTGFALNPISGQPYAADPVKRGDFARVIAEFWADGPNSETPPGHWHVLTNEVSDDPLTVKKIGGTGAVVNNLEWDVKAYFAVAASVHDAACACWANKRYYNGPRPITMIRYMGTMGQSSNPALPSYNTQGLPLVDGIVELITDASTDTGGHHELIWNLYTNAFEPGFLHIGEIAVYSFPGEGRTNPPAQLPALPATTQNSVCWMLAKDWLPFQRKTFNTPAFPGYPSGHSTFSRSAAEVLTLLTGSSSFPGGIHSHIISMDTMQIDLGPSADVDLQWNTYYDAADQAGQSRRWGGIHPSEDDYAGRIIGSQIGPRVFALSQKYWNGTIVTEQMLPQITILGNGNVQVAWTALRGMKYKVQSSPDLIHWTDATSYALTYTNGAISGDVNGTYTDTTPGAGQKFYRILRTPGP